MQNKCECYKLLMFTGRVLKICNSDIVYVRGN